MKAVIKRPRKVIGLLISAVAFVIAAIVAGFVDEAPDYLPKIFDGLAAIAATFGICVVPPNVEMTPAPGDSVIVENGKKEVAASEEEIKSF